MPTSSFVTLVVLLTIAAVIYIELASMPGKTARERGHPHADAISLLGWIGLLLGIAPWLVAMVWARMPPFAVTHEDTPVSAPAAAPATKGREGHDHKAS
jgi:hypothetical protein